MKIRIGTRKSELARKQAELVCEALVAAVPTLDITVVTMSTRGDEVLDRSLTTFGGKGVFTKELEEALLRDEIDFVVHSAKDLPIVLPEGLAIGAVLKRGNPADVLLTRSGVKAVSLAKGSVIGTSSLRRERLIRNLNPGVEIKLLRGNVRTRIQKLLDGEYDGILLAAAGLERIEFVDESITLEYLDTTEFLPAVGQGILAIEVIKGKWKVILQKIHDEQTYWELLAERSFLSAMDGGCNAPCAALARVEETAVGEGLQMQVMSSRMDEIKKCQGAIAVSKEESIEVIRERAVLLGKQLASNLWGMVTLVGAGPGDRGLVTEKGIAILREADTVVYDKLIPLGLLQETREDAELIYVGKQAGLHHCTQEEIQKILIQKAKDGKQVVRLKGGDPYLYGRGSEEVIALAEQGIMTEVISGVSALSSVPAALGIPLTHRGISSQVHILTGHEQGTESTTSYVSEAMQEGTVVCFMGLGNLESVVASLVRMGRSKETPVCVIQHGTTSKQCSVTATLETIVNRVVEAGIGTPALLVVGEVVKLQEQLIPTKRNTLSEQSTPTVLLTGTAALVRKQEEQCKEARLQALPFSLIATRCLPRMCYGNMIAKINEFEWLFFASVNSVNYFFEILKEENLDIRVLANKRVAAIGSETMEALREKGILADFSPKTFSSEGVAEEWVKQLPCNVRVLLLRAKGGSRVLAEKLEEQGVAFVEAEIYESYVLEQRKDALNHMIKEADYISLASAGAARAFASLCKEENQKIAKVICIGEATAKEAREQGLEVEGVASIHSTQGIVDFILRKQGGSTNV